MAREPSVTGKTLREWAPIAIAILGAGIVWGTTQASLAQVSARVTSIETSKGDEERWRHLVDQRLTAIMCHLDRDTCLRQR